MLEGDDVRNMTCPYTGHKKRCIDIRRKRPCPKWVTLAGKNPQDGSELPRSGCADAWTPLLLVQNTQRMHEIAAALDGYRNELHQLGSVVIGGAEHHTKAVGNALAMILQKTVTTEKLLVEATFGGKLQVAVRGIVRAELEQSADAALITEGESNDNDNSDGVHQLDEDGVPDSPGSGHS